MRGAMGSPCLKSIGNMFLPRVTAFAYGPHFRNGTSFFLESEPCARPMRNVGQSGANGHRDSHGARCRGDRRSPARTTEFGSSHRLARPFFSRTHDCLACRLCTRTGRPPVAPTGGILCDCTAPRVRAKAQTISSAPIERRSHRRCLEACTVLKNRLFYEWILAIFCRIY